MARKTRKRKSKPTPPQQERTEIRAEIGAEIVAENREEICAASDDAQSRSTAIDASNTSSSVHVEPGSNDSFSESDIEVWLGERESVVQAVETNAHLLQKLINQVGDLQDAAHSASPSFVAKKTDANELGLRARIEELEAQLEEVQEQNNELASQVARSSVEDAVNSAESGTPDALSWEDRKEMIFRQMEDDSFDADEFVSSLAKETKPTATDELADNSQPADANVHISDDQSTTTSEETAEAMEKLMAELDRRDAMIRSRDEEIENLRHLLSQQPDPNQEGVAVGAAAIAAIVDSDELIQQERERLQLLQAEWEEKFRATEIEASLERAKLSRDRRELGQRQEELEIEIEQLRRQLRVETEQGSGSRKWRSKLGLTD
jgi:hypothetical protein